jgi:hypothetical protein
MTLWPLKRDRQRKAKLNKRCLRVFRQKRKKLWRILSLRKKVKGRQMRRS